MTTISIQDRVAEIFVDARLARAQTVERFEAGDIRDATEKAWWATKRATDAFVLARIREEAGTAAGTTNGLNTLTSRHPDTRKIPGRYYSRIHNLHGMYFYAGFCNDQTERRIRETAAYIDIAKTCRPRELTAFPSGKHAVFLS